MIFVRFGFDEEKSSPILDFARAGDVQVSVVAFRGTASHQSRSLFRIDLYHPTRRLLIPKRPPSIVDRLSRRRACPCGLLFSRFPWGRNRALRRKAEASTFCANTHDLS